MEESPAIFSLNNCAVNGTARRLRSMIGFESSAQCKDKPVLVLGTSQGAGEGQTVKAGTRKKFAEQTRRAQTAA